jgi:hypothetical protein
MNEFRKKLTQNEIDSGTIFWRESQDADLRSIIPQTLVFDLVLDGEEYANLSVEWDKRRLFLGGPLAGVVEGAEIVLRKAKGSTSTVECLINIPLEKVVIRKRLSHLEHNQRYLKWYAREDDLYLRLLPQGKDFQIEVCGKRGKGREADFEKRKIVIGDALRIFSPGDDLILSLDDSGSVPVLIISREELANSNYDGSTPLRSLITRLLSRPLNDFREGEIRGLIVLLEENKKLWERLVGIQDENRHLKEQVNMLESLLEQFSVNSFFNSKREFEAWVASHINLFEKGTRLLHQDYTVSLPDGKKRRIDLLCQDKKGVLVAVEILFNPDMRQLDETLNLMDVLKENIESFGTELTGGLLKATDIRCMIISNHEKTDLVEYCLQRGVKLCMVNSGCVIDILE